MDIMIETCENISEYVKTKSNSSSIFMNSVVPLICRQEPCILGVDEAGRGPVLGPMVYGICYCPISKSKSLNEVECADSKALTEKKREEIFDAMCQLQDHIGWAVDIISPNVICNAMLKRVKHSLNQVAQDSTVNLIQYAINQGVKVTEIYVDTVGPPEKYQEKLSNIFPSIKITVAKKADSTYPIVSAASICAKVTRDRVIQVWQFPEGLEYPDEGFGSGYPNDPVTKKFLSGNVDHVFGFPQLVRFSWSTATKFLENIVPVEWEEEEGAEFANNTAITSFFKFHSKEKQHETKHSFFSQRKLCSSTSF